MLNIGKVNKVNFIYKTNKNGEHYKMAFVYFEYLYSNHSVDSFINSLENKNKTTKIVYDDPWYWVCLPYHNLYYTLEKNKYEPTNHLIIQ